MKRFITILFTAIYLCASAGVLFNIHYCNDQVESFELQASEESCCCDDDALMEDCCSNETIFLKSDHEQQIVQKLRTATNFLDLIDMVVHHEVQSNEIDKNESDPERFDFPIPPKQPLWLRNCSLTYYG